MKTPFFFQLIGSFLLGCAARNEAIEPTPATLKQLTTCHSNSGLNRKFLYAKKEQKVYLNTSHRPMVFYESKLHPDSCHLIENLKGISLLNVGKYKITLNKIAKGSMVYCTITCSDYKVSGKIMRSK